MFIILSVFCFAEYHHSILHVRESWIIVGLQNLESCMGTGIHPNSRPAHNVLFPLRRYRCNTTEIVTSNGKDS